MGRGRWACPTRSSSGAATSRSAPFRKKPARRDTPCFSPTRKPSARRPWRRPITPTTNGRRLLFRLARGSGVGGLAGMARDQILPARDRGDPAAARPAETGPGRFLPRAGPGLLRRSVQFPSSLRADAAARPQPSLADLGFAAQKRPNWPNAPKKPRRQSSGQDKKSSSAHFRLKMMFTILAYLENAPLRRAGTFFETGA